MQRVQFRRKHSRETTSSRIFDLVINALLLVITVIMVYPFLSVVAMSMSSNSHLAMGDVTFYPKGFTLNAFQIIFQDKLILKSYLNTIGYALGSVVCTLICTSLIAYPLSIDDFMAKKAITIYLTITMFLGGGLIPTYLWIRQLGLVDTYWVMVVPGCVSAYNVFVFRTFFQGISKELREAAYIDGANDVVLLWKVILPLSKPLMATYTLFTVVGVWNSWFNALIYLSDETKYPLQLILRRYLFNDLSSIGGVINEGMQRMLQEMHINPKSVQMAIVVVAMAPIMCIYPFVQKYFVKGVALGSVKG